MKLSSCREVNVSQLLPRVGNVLSEMEFIVKLSQEENDDSSSSTKGVDDVINTSMGWDYNYDLQNYNPEFYNLYHEDGDDYDDMDSKEEVDEFDEENGLREKVWKEINNNLSFGETATHGDITKRCDSASTPHTDVTAMKTNPISLVIPIHDEGDMIHDISTLL